MNEKKQTKRMKALALTMAVALLGVVFGVALSMNLSASENASAESFSAMTLAASTSSELDSPFKSVYQQASESVVGIKLTTQTRVYGGRISTDTVYVGSGVAIGDGYVVTNYHVATAAGTQNTDGIIVVYGDAEYPATYIAGDEDTDIAVLKVDNLPAPAAVLGNSDELSIGDWALVIGNPLGEAFANTLTIGVISGQDRDLSRAVSNMSISTSMIQTNAQINSGNSGGGLFNIRGELVGITSVKVTSGSYSSNSVEGIGFAIPINTVTGVIDELIAHGKVLSPRLGVTIQQIQGSDEPTAKSLPSSLWVRQVEKNSPAEAAGIQVDDLIYAADDQRITSTTDLQKVLKSHEIGDLIEIVVYRVPNVRLDPDQDLPEGEFVTLEVEVKIIDA